MSGFGYNVLGFGANASSAAGGPVDDEFNRVSFLSHFDGTNNGVNSTFDDGSDSNHTITTNGDVTQGSFNPYGTNWAVDFSKDDNPRLSCASSADFTFGTGDFTVEFFVFFYSLTTYQTPMSAGYSNDSGGMFIQTGNGDGKFQFRSGGSALVSETTSDDEANKWYHIAFSRQSGTLRVYRNGVQTGTASNSTNLNRTGNILIGSANDLNIDGLLSNFRLVKGTSLYNSNFTPPASALTAVTNTTLLTLQSNRFVDNSASGHTVSPNTGKEVVTSFGPFLTSAVYDPSVNGASAFFDGSGDYLSAPTIISSSGNFTIEGWVYSTGTGTGVICGQYALSQTGRMVIESTSNHIKYFQDGVTTYTGSSNETKNQWCHFVAMRTGSNLAFYVNGTRVHNVSAANMYQGNFEVGGEPSISYYHKGYISNIRCTASAVYSEGASITVPTAPYSTVTNTNLLLNMADGQAIDSAAQNNLTLAGTAKTSTAQKKFGTSSMVFTTGSAALAPKDFLAFGPGNFTVEFFVRFDDPSSLEFLIDGRPYTVNGPYFTLYSSTGLLKYSVSNTVRITGSSALNADTFYHVAVCRSGTDTKMFVDGTQIGSTYSDSNDYLTSDLNQIGRYVYNSNYDFKGYMDELRISRMARYTANFTAPSEPFADKGQ